LQASDETFPQVARGTNHAVQQATMAAARERVGEILDFFAYAVWASVLLFMLGYDL
jgi:hypothetical protein